MGIRFVLLVNKQGQTRLAQYYEYLTLEERRALEGEIVRKCLARTDQQCSFVEHRNYKVVYRRYASLFFLVGVDNDEKKGAVAQGRRSVGSSETLEALAVLEMAFGSSSCHGLPTWMTSSSSPDTNMGFAQRSLSAAGAAVLSAVLVNLLDVAKIRLQAQAAGVIYCPAQHQFRRQITCFGPNMMFSEFKCSPSCVRSGILRTVPICPPDCFQYKGTLDVFYKVIRQEGFARLWRGTNAGLALAIPTVGIYLPCYDIFRNWIEDFATQNAPYLAPYAPLVAGSLARSLACITCSPIELARTRMQAFKEFSTGSKPPGMWKTMFGVLSPPGNNNLQNLQSFRVLWTGVGAQLARDVPYSAICWSTLEPIRRRLLALFGEEGNAAGILGANFSAGFVAGSLAAAATCPLDVVKTRRQIEKDPTRARIMTTRQTLVEVWREGGCRGLFMGVGPRVARAGPSVGIVISFYKVVKYVLHRRNAD